MHVVSCAEMARAPQTHRMRASDSPCADLPAHADLAADADLPTPACGLARLLLVVVVVVLVLTIVGVGVIGVSRVQLVHDVREMFLDVLGHVSFVESGPVH